MSPFDQGQQNLVVFFISQRHIHYLGRVSPLLRTQVFLISWSLRKIQQNWGFEPPAMENPGSSTHLSILPGIVFIVKNT